jgi:A/G-specific adenine glycosylase
MLQQTQVDTVIDYYKAFIKRFPSVTVLADAEEDAVLKAWEGLGYYSRAKNLQRAAKEIKEKYHGQIPSDYDQILALPGIGPYTAGAVASIAFDQPYPAVDGNVMRVFSRLFNINDDIMQNATRKKMEDICRLVVSEENPSSFNQGLMELGATVCTPTSPKCTTCPLYGLCEANKLGIEAQLPVKKKKEKQREVVMEMALVYAEGKILITKRPATGLLADLWALPSVEKDAALANGESIRLELEETYGVKVKNLVFSKNALHIFTHIKWQMKLYRMEMTETVMLQYPETSWIRLSEFNSYALPTAFKKLLDFTSVQE